MLSGSDGGGRDRYQLRVFGVKPRLPTLSNFSQKRMHRKDSKEVPVSTAVTEQAGASKDRRRLGQGAWDTDIPLWSVPVPARLHSSRFLERDDPVGPFWVTGLSLWLSG